MLELLKYSTELEGEGITIILMFITKGAPQGKEIETLKRLIG